VDSPQDKLEFFVHWDQFNKRLDEWVSGSRIILSRDLEWPRPKLTGKKSAAANKANPPAKARNQSLKKTAMQNAAEFNAPSPSPAAGSPAPSKSLKRKAPHDEDSESVQQDDEEDPDADADAEADADADVDADADGEMDIDTIEIDQPAAKTPQPLSAFSKEQEIEKLRTSGSMTQSISEIARVKNLNRLQIGKHEVEAWYFSPYPREFAHLDILYICEFCLQYFPSPFMLKRHRSRCTLLHPPGNEIYRHEDVSFWEIDGRKQVNWCRNLSLLSKCFLDQ